MELNLRHDEYGLEVINILHVLVGNLAVFLDNLFRLPRAFDADLSHQIQNYRFYIYHLIAFQLDKAWLHHHWHHIQKYGTEGTSKRIIEESPADKIKNDALSKRVLVPIRAKF
jgi:hypothetical protein